MANGFSQSAPIAPQAPSYPRGGRRGSTNGFGSLAKMGNAALGYANRVASFFPGQQVGKSIGTLAGYGIEKAKGALGGQDNSQFYDTSAPKPRQVLGDVAQGALMVAGPKFAGSAGSALGRIGQSAAVGAGFGATNQLKQDTTSPSAIFKSSLKSAVIGGALGAVGEGLGRLLQGRIDPKAYTTIQNHVNSAKNQISGLQPAEIDQLGGLDKYMNLNKVDLARQLENQGFYDIANKVNGLSTAGIKNIGDYTNAITRALVPGGGGGFGSVAAAAAHR